MAKDIETQIRARIDTFASELAELVQLAALESVQEALGGLGTKAVKGGRRGPGRPRGSKATTRRKTRASAGSRQRRSSGQIEELSLQIFSHVKSNQGQRLEEISRDLAIPSKELKRPVATLIGEKRLRTTGQKRGTKYFAKGRAPKAVRKKA